MLLLLDHLWVSALFIVVDVLSAGLVIAVENN
jgi:hypothetical protein